jgi:uncharacterized protein YbjT (DUF2867 family)
MAKNTILVTGATGNVGYEVVRQLAALNNPDVMIRAAVRVGENQSELFPPSVVRVPFDFTTPETYRAAFEGVDTMFLMRPPAIANIARDMQPALDAAQTAGVKHVVLLSLLGVERNRFVPHAKIEDALHASTMTWTFLRCGFFMQNLTTTHLAEIRDRGEIFIPAGHGKTSFIDVRDIAAVAARALTEDGHAGKVYPLTGGEALDYDEIAAILSDVLRRPIRYANPSLLAFVRALRRQGRHWDYVGVLTAIYATTRFGLAGSVTDDVPRLLGRAPITFRQFAEDHRRLWEQRQQQAG